LDAIVILNKSKQEKEVGMCCCKLQREVAWMHSFIIVAEQGNVEVTPYIYICEILVQI